KFQHFVYEAGWRANAGYYDKSLRKDKWYNDKIYEDSIYKVIPQAIADCLQKKAEFENVGEIVTFEAKDHTGYSPENWNAVVLWNYLEYAIHKHGVLSNDGVSAVGAKLKTYYGEKYCGYIQNAVSDIQTYATDLSLYGYIKRLSQRCVILKQYSAHDKSGQFKVNGAMKYKNIIFRGDIFITIEGGKVTAIEPEKAHFKKFENINKYMEVSDEIKLSKKIMTPLDIDKMLLDANKINAFKNYINVLGQIEGNKCYINSAITALYNSPRFRATIERLVNMPKEEGVTDWKVSVAIKKLFGIIEGIIDVDEQDATMADLIDRMERTQYKQKKGRESIEDPDTIIGKSIYRAQEYKNPNDFAKEIIQCLNYEIENSGGELSEIFKIYTIQEARINDIVYTGTCHDGAVIIQALSGEKDLLEVLQQMTNEIPGGYRGKITKAPETLFIEKGYTNLNYLHDFTSPEVFALKTNEGIKKYKVVSTVQYDKGNNHAVASIRTNQGWYVVDSLYRSVKPLGDKFIETLPNDQRNLYYLTLIYEQIS
ncbi:MAG: hypothetical protein IJS10_02700, partial [Alphaproteobacteria bacterium]|nr:hypothetical protein [Alphaproteobacteria bacterium]